jgi:predicted O-linked N-acetylglucosamine transferase (SPINDLY family)
MPANDDIGQRARTALAARIPLVRQLLRDGDRDRAMAIASDPTTLAAPDALRRLGAEFSAYPRAHARWLRTVLAQRPDDFEAMAQLAATLQNLGESTAALDLCERALAQRPDDATVREIRALALVDRGDVESGLAELRELVPGNAATAARHLVVMHYDPAQDNETLFATHVDFVRKHVRAFGAPFERIARDADKPLRIGWLSPRLGEGPVARFFAGLLSAFDRTQHRHVVVALQPVFDETGAAIARLADEAVMLAGLDDTTLLEALRRLELDVLVDLAGHATANRTGVVAQRVAPLQVCWLDWFDTTAVPAMNAWISDRWLTPENGTQRYTERVVRLDAGRFCYTPRPDAPEPRREPSSQIVFASFNRLAKFNDDVVATWSRILLAVPNSRLELRTRMLADAGTQAHIRARFAAHGVDGGRLNLIANVPYRELLDAYARVDVVLDPFPFSGCTTTCDALWMGCPVVTLPGETFVSRQSASLLSRLGREEWIAHSRDDYVERTIALARGADTLRTQRATLRETVHEKLCDAPAQARDFAAALRMLWREKCALSDPAR